MNKEFDNILELAKSYLAKKERKNYYETKSYEEPDPGYSYVLTELSDEEVRQIRALKERYGEDFVNHLEEVFDDEDVISDLFYGENYVDIDTETVYHKYRFRIHEIGKEDKLSSRPVLIQLLDEDYAKLLVWHIFDEHLVINTLFYRDEALCRKIMREAMLSFCLEDDFFMISDPFVVTMDEALSDAEQIRQENDIKKYGYYYGLNI